MITVKHDNFPASAVQELCFKCWQGTNYWFTPKDVACCQECAKTVTAEEVPSKEEWCKQVFKKLGELD